MQSSGNNQAGVQPAVPAIRKRKPNGGDRPNIVYFDHTAIMSGGEIALFNLITALDKTRYQPIVILATDGPLAERLAESNVEVHILPLDKTVLNTRKDTLKAGALLKIATVIKSVFYTFRLARLLKARGADLLHTNSLKADVLGGIAARMARVPVIWHVRDRIADDYLPPTATKLFRAGCKIIPDYIIANSQATMDTLSTGVAVRSAVVHSGSTNQQLRVVHDGIPEHAMSPKTGPDVAPMVGLVGRLSSWKGQHIFIEAASMVVKEFPRTKFQIIGSAMFGEDEYEKMIRQMVVDLGLQDNVEFTGYVTDVPQRVAKLDVLVHASTTGEPFGQVVIEGMVAGKPVIATRGGGVVEIVEDGVTGILVPMSDAKAMAEAMKRLLSDPAFATAMGLRGRVRVLQHFTIEQTANKVHEIYAEFME